MVGAVDGGRTPTSSLHSHPFLHFSLPLVQNVRPSCPLFPGVCSHRSNGGDQSRQRGVHETQGEELRHQRVPGKMAMRCVHEDLPGRHFAGKARFFLFVWESFSLTIRHITRSEKRPTHSFTVCVGEVSRFRFTVVASMKGRSCRFQSFPNY